MAEGGRKRTSRSVIDESLRLPQQVFEHFVSVDILVKIDGFRLRLGGSKNRIFV